MQAILIYETDTWHSKGTRNLIAIATTEKKRDRLVREYMKEFATKKETNEAIDEIRHNGQTSFLSEKYDIELDTETTETNIIL